MTTAYANATVVGDFLIAGIQPSGFGFVARRSSVSSLILETDVGSFRPETLSPGTLVHFSALLHGNTIRFHAKYKEYLKVLDWFFGGAAPPKEILDLQDAVAREAAWQAFQQGIIK